MRPLALLAFLTVLGAGCGGLDNYPLEVGTVLGRVGDADPAVAQVTHVPSGVTTGVDASGAFTLKDVPAGATALFVIAQGHLALNAPVVVRGGALTLAGTLTPKPAGQVTVHLKNVGLPNPQAATLDVSSTPFKANAFDTSGVGHAGPLPDGCYQATVTHPTAGSVQLSFCMSQGLDQALDATLP